VVDDQARKDFAVFYYRGLDHRPVLLRSANTGQEGRAEILAARDIKEWIVEREWKR